MPVYKGGRVAKLLITWETIIMNSSSTFLNVYEYTLYTKGSSCGIIDILVIESALDNEKIYILHDMSKWYMYVYLASKLFSSNMEIQSIILGTIFLLLIWCPGG